MTDEEALEQARSDFITAADAWKQQLEGDIRRLSCSDHVVPLIITSGYMANAPAALDVFKRYAQLTAANDQTYTELIADNLGSVEIVAGTSLLALEGTRVLADADRLPSSIARFVPSPKAIPYVGAAIGAAMEGFEMYQGFSELDAYRISNAAASSIGFGGGCAVGAGITHWAGSWVPILGNAVAGGIGCIVGGVLGSMGANALEDELDIGAYYQEGFDQERNDMLDALGGELRALYKTYGQSFNPLLEYEAAYQQWFNAYNHQDRQGMLGAETMMRQSFDRIVGNGGADEHSSGIQPDDLEMLQAIGANLYDQLTVLQRIAGETDPDNAEAIERLDALQERVLRYSSGVQFLLYANQNWQRYNGEFREQFTAEHNHLMTNVFPCLREGRAVEVSPIMYSPDETPLNENIFVLPQSSPYSMQF